MFYTLMQRYLCQQLQQMQTLQYQQRQYMAWQYQQLQSWQHAMLSSVFFNQMRWLPNNGWAVAFAKPSQAGQTNDATPQQNAPQAPLSADVPMSDSSTAANRTAHAQAIELPLSDAEKVLRQMQRDESHLPAPVQLEKVDMAITSSAHSNNLPAALPTMLPTIEPVSALEQTRQSVDVIDLNQATEAQLLRLEGINRRVAKDIVTYRDNHTAFTQVDELTNIKGIGEATLNKIRHCLIIHDNGQSTVKTDAADKLRPTQHHTDQKLSPKPSK